jgi:energy-coupling factor transporter ATP-binding protein EcfA2
MITELHLTNFRGFEDHTIPFRPLTIIVGRNNAGKSTIVEALRLISLVVSRFKGRLDLIPRLWQFPKDRRGPDGFKNLEINLQSIFYDYGEPPARIRASFSSGEVVEIRIDHNEIVGLCDRAGATRPVGPPPLARVSILPQVAPVLRQERLLTEDYVRSALSSSLAPLHFRNQLYIHPDLFKQFKDVAEETWPGLRIRELRIDGAAPNPIVLSLLVDDFHFPAEIAWMGHGLQMWLQTMWFLTRASAHETVILDEPDVYMHADLQRRLVRYVRASHQQVVIATHSSEIMAEVSPENILVIDRARSASDFASSLPAVQKVLSGVGSIHNLQLSRLWNSRRFLMVEGDDIGILKHLQNAVLPNSRVPIDTIPSRSIGGWGGWSYAIGSEMFLQNAGGEGIITYCILDSDYHTTEEIDERMQDSKTRDISLHIWKKKELENYLLVPIAIHRLIEQKVPEGKAPPSLYMVVKVLQQIVADLLDDTVDSFATCIQARDRKIVVATANQRARELVAKRWNNLTERLGVVGGKKALARLAEWSQKKFGVSIGATNLAATLTSEEIDSELMDVMSALELNEVFPD